MIEKVNIAEKFKLFQDQWSPKIAGEVNDSQVKLVKLQGEFVWHKHEAEDEMFLVVKGGMTIRLRDGEVRLGEGEFVIIPASSTCRSPNKKHTSSSSSRKPS